MSTKNIITQGDSTSHGGTVLSGSSLVKIDGKKAALVGDEVYCPACKGTYVIIEGSSNLRYSGTAVALDGMQTSCGATLISSQSKAKAK